MGLFEGKKGLILGVANDRSIAWAIAEKIMAEGGECGFTHLPDREDDDKKKNRRRVEKCFEKSESGGQPKFLVPLNVQDDDQIAAVMATAGKEFGQIDFLLHSIAFADRADLSRDTVETSREGFKMAMEISCYSLIAVTNAARSILSEGAAIACMTYFGGEKIVPGYNVMGICKAALEATTRYLAYDLGPNGVRVNALSAGPMKTLAGTQPELAKCSRCTSTSRRWVATSLTKRSAIPARSCSPQCRTGSPAKFSTSMRVTTRWARPAAWSSY